MIKSLLRDFVPPIIPKFIRSLKNKKFSYAEYELVPQGWEAEKSSRRIKGWNEVSILEAYKKRLPDLERRCKSSEVLSSDLGNHNNYMIFAYAFALTGRLHNKVSLLDWGGGIGQYKLICHSLFPTALIDYHCKDVPVLVEYGAQLFPNAKFYSDDSCLENRYDFIFASGSLHYSKNWKDILEKIARSATSHILITRTPFVQTSPSFVFVQRPYIHGYDTEYLGWCINQKEFLQHAEDCGMVLIREFVMAERPFIVNAPEACQYKSFLFSLKS